MATESQVIDKVRRAVADFKQPHKFEKSFYLDAIEFALGKLNHDFGIDPEYIIVSDIPNSKLFLLLKLAIIQMAYTRASAIMDSENDPSSAENAAISSVQVPDLLVSGPDSSEARDAETWLELANRLQEEYDGELEQSGGTSQSASVQIATIYKISLRHGGYISRKLDPGPAATVVVTLSSGSDVVVSWDKLYASDFYSYEIYRSIQVDMSDEERIAVIIDNDTVEYTDEGLVSGTYYYRVKTINRNQLETNSNISEAIV